ncbi:hypothetical protein M6B38_317510 [Iris pallida]|uniref:Uncharacterized protein n=1 Tax=Iris pallida TaxID=29817 RepID=A0AAX6HDF0_IRIPA|nr:hypothetical protein M6B38_317510 [Iris pallida]
MLFAFRSEASASPSVKRESLLSRDVILLDFSSAALIQAKARSVVCLTSHHKLHDCLPWGFTGC